MYLLTCEGGTVVHTHNKLVPMLSFHTALESRWILSVLQVSLEGQVGLKTRPRRPLVL